MPNNLKARRNGEKPGGIARLMRIKAAYIRPLSHRSIVEAQCVMGVRIKLPNSENIVLRLVKPRRHRRRKWAGRGAVLLLARVK